MKNNDLTEAEVKLGKIVFEMLYKEKEAIKKKLDDRTPTLVPKGQVRVIRLDMALNAVEEAFTEFLKKT